MKFLLWVRDAADIVTFCDKIAVLGNTLARYKGSGRFLVPASLVGEVGLMGWKLI